MSSISMVEARLPPGFRFHPRDDELVMDYLCRKLSGKGGGAYGGIDMIDVDLNKCEPWDLPGACFNLPPPLQLCLHVDYIYYCSAGILHHWKLQLSWCRHMKTSVEASGRSLINQITHNSIENETKKKENNGVARTRTGDLQCVRLT
jgi:hypothetical protein